MFKYKLIQAKVQTVHLEYPVQSFPLDEWISRNGHPDSLPSTPHPFIENKLLQRCLPTHTPELNHTAQNENISTSRNSIGIPANN